MHTVRRQRNTWLVQFVEGGGNEGYRADRDTIARFSDYRDAYSFCSFLNGGQGLVLGQIGYEELEKQNELFDLDNPSDE